MYGIAITQHEKIPDLLLKLSELLRYSVYESKELYVPLKDEFSYINNYIDFEKLRLGDRLSLSTDIGKDLMNNNGRIAPMLLIVFVENAFKHSRNTTDEKIFVDIAAKTWRDTVLFSVKNSYTENKAGFIVPEKSSGMGLENAKKRLELLYPGAYDLKVTEEAGFYTVMLRLNIKR
jgi:LytS/YehU family sensor histidine kinase